MKTSFSDIVATERFLRGELPAEERIVFEARLLVDEEVRRNTAVHRLIHRLVTLYHRKKLRQQAEQVYERLWSDESKAAFRNDIQGIFNH